MAQSQAKPDLVLSDGREISIDLTSFTAKEYDDIIAESNVEPELRHELIGRSVGMTGDELYNLPFVDYSRITKSFYKRCRDPLSDPNSASESTLAS